MKKAIIVSLSIFSIFIFSNFIADSAQAVLNCSVTSGSCGGTTILKMYSTSNSHAEIVSGTVYNNYVCCSGESIGTNCGSADAAVVLRLSGTTNAHVEENIYSNYSTNVCLSPPSGKTVACTYYGGTSCLDLGSDYTCLASISAATNAHVGNCSAYSTKVCCAVTSEPDFSISIPSGYQATVRAPRSGSSQPQTAIKITPLNGFNSPVTLSLLPSGQNITATFGSNPVSSPYNDSSLTFTTSNVSPGTYNLTIQGTGGGKTHTVIVVLIVPSPSVALTADPSSGNPPLNGVDLSAVVSGTAVGTVNFKFHNNSQTSPASWEHCFDGVDLSISDIDWVLTRKDTNCTADPADDHYTHKTKVTAPNKFEVQDLYSYSTAGTFYPRVKVERDMADSAENYTTVTVNDVCTRANPTVEFTPTSYSGSAGSPTSYSVKITNKDNLVCGNSTFNLTFSCPVGWTDCSLSKSVTASIGSEGYDSAILNVTSPTGAAAADYNVSVTATNAGTGLSSYTKTQTANYTVTSCVVGGTCSTVDSICCSNGVLYKCQAGATYTIYPKDDIWVYLGTPDMNRGQSGSLILGRWAGNTAFDYFKFNLKSIPEGVTIGSAVFSFYFPSVPSTAFSAEIHKTSDLEGTSANQWSERTLTWGKKPDPGDLLGSVTFPVSASLRSASSDSRITSYIQSEVDNYYNNGKIDATTSIVLIHSLTSGGDSYYSMNSKDIGVSSLWPILYVAVPNQWAFDSNCGSGSCSSPSTCFTCTQIQKNCNTTGVCSGATNAYHFDLNYHCTISGGDNYVKSGDLKIIDGGKITMMADSCLSFASGEEITLEGDAQIIKSNVNTRILKRDASVVGEEACPVP